eukprot:scaffold16087_cov48-Attheya_sp.AAC.5
MIVVGTRRLYNCINVRHKDSTGVFPLLSLSSTHSGKEGSRLNKAVVKVATVKVKSFGQTKKGTIIDTHHQHSQKNTTTTNRSKPWRLVKGEDPCARKNPEIQLKRCSENCVCR